MFNYSIVNSPSSFSLNTETLNSIFLTISQEENTIQNGTLNIVFLWDDEIQQLNNNYRQKNSTTDVLSFHYSDDFSELKSEETAWEIILSEAKIISQWVEYKLWSEKECYKLIIHSIYHILWYDHEEDADYKVMKEKEESIWKKIF